MPWEYDRLPLEIINWLMPVHVTLQYMEQQAQQDTHQRARNRHGNQH